MAKVEILGETRFDRRRFLKTFPGLFVGFSSTLHSESYHPLVTTQISEQGRPGWSINVETDPGEIRVLTEMMVEKGNSIGLDILGYRISDAWKGADGSVYMAYQRHILKYSNDNLVLFNTLDELYKLGLDEQLKDGSLGIIIPPREAFTDSDGDINQLFEERANALKLPYWLRRELFLLRKKIEIGLPTSSLIDFGSFKVLRLQTGAIQIWSYGDSTELEWMLVVDAVKSLIIPKEVLLSQPDVKEQGADNRPKASEIIVSRDFKDYYKSPGGKFLLVNFPPDPYSLENYGLDPRLVNVGYKITPGTSTLTEEQVLSKFDQIIDEANAILAPLSSHKKPLNEIKIILDPSLREPRYYLDTQSIVSYSGRTLKEDSDPRIANNFDRITIMSIRNIDIGKGLIEIRRKFGNGLLDKENIDEVMWRGITSPLVSHFLSEPVYFMMWDPNLTLADNILNILRGRREELNSPVAREYRRRVNEILEVKEEMLGKSPFIEFISPYK